MAFAFASVRTLMRFNNRLGTGRTLRESDMGNLNYLTDLLGYQLAVPFHRKLGRTAKVGQTQTRETCTHQVLLLP